MNDQNKHNINMAGIDHTSAGIDIRERFSITAGRQAEVLKSIRGMVNVDGCVLIVTCNRTEVWISGTADPYICLCSALGILAEAHENSFIKRGGKDAVRHLFELAGGLKSLIFAEDQILSQVKDAIAASRNEHCADALLEKLFSVAVSAAKKIKTDVRFASADHSIAESAAKLIQSAYPESSGVRCLVIGNGEMGKLAAQLLNAAGFNVCSTVRQHKSGNTLIPSGCNAVMYEDRYRAVKASDVIVSATKSPHYTVTAADYPADGKKRLLVDLAVPRDIDPGVAKCAGTALIGVDELSSPDAGDSRELAQAYAIIDAYTAQFYDWLRLRGIAPAIDEISGIVAMDASGRVDAVLGGLSMDELNNGELSLYIRQGVQNAVRRLMYGLADSGGGGNLIENALSSAKQRMSELTPLNDAQPDGKDVLPCSFHGYVGAGAAKKMFPLFVDVAGKKLVIFGGGKVALRRVSALMAFDCKLVLVSPALSPGFERIQNNFTWIQRNYEAGDCVGADIVVAATDSRAVNGKIAAECRLLKIPASIADCKEECTFYFPAIITQGDITAGICADGKNHTLVKRVAQNIRNMVHE